MKTETFNRLNNWTDDENSIERYETNIDYIDNSYLFTLDYGTYTSSFCSISEDGTIVVDYGSLAIFDNEELTQRKKDIIKEILEPIFGSEAERIAKNGVSKISSAFKKVEEFIINNDKFVSDELEQKFNKMEKHNNYDYRTVYDEGLGTVSFYIKSKLFDDEIGIIIYQDGSFMPIISTKHINLIDLAKKQRLEAIKEFVAGILKVKINFGTVDGVNPIKIPDLIKKATAYAKENGTIEYTDDHGDVYIYKEAEPGVTTINGIGRI